MSPNLKVVASDRLSPTRQRLAEIIEALNRASADVEAAGARATRLREVIAAAAEEALPRANEAHRLAMGSRASPSGQVAHARRGSCIKRLRHVISDRIGNPPPKLRRKNRARLAGHPTWLA